MSRWGSYMTKDGRHVFKFRIQDRGGRFEIVCVQHPPFGGATRNVHTTHLYSNGRICFTAGREPRSVDEAESRAAEWAEFFSEHVSTRAL